MKLHLRTEHDHQNCLSLFVLLIILIRRTVHDKWTKLYNSMSPVNQTWHTNCLLTYSMEQSPSWDSNRISASHFPSFYRTRRFITALKVPASVSIRSQLDPVHTPTSHFLKIHSNIILPSTTRSPKWSLSSPFPHQNSVYTSPLPILYSMHCHNWYLSY